VFIGAKCVPLGEEQHPRDLFDVRELLANEGIDDALRKAFIVYLVSHNRPMAELLAPARLDLTSEFERGFDGETSLTLDELIAAREMLIAKIAGEMPENHPGFCSRSSTAIRIGRFSTYRVRKRCLRYVGSWRTS
jgi:hypothetical protein